MKNNKNAKRHLSDIIKSNKIIFGFFRFFGSAFFRFIGLFIPVKKNQILFSSMSGDIYGGSPKVLYERIKKEYGDKYTYIWALSKTKEHSECDCRRIKIDSFKYAIVALRSGIWITDVNIERGLSFKRKNNYYVNTWHGTILKSGIKQRKDYCFDKVNILCCDGPLTLQGYKKYYRLTREDNVLECGRPREDILYGDIQRKTSECKKKYNVGNKITILFAPTFREDETIISRIGGLYGLDIKHLKEKLGDKFIILFKAHHFSTISIKDNDFFIDCSKEEDINYLYLASDILITDYSSTMFDFGLLKRPVICFAPDYDDYVKRRGIEINLTKEFPGGVASTTLEVFEKIVFLSKDSHQNQFNAFFSKHVKRGNNACDEIIERMKEEKILK